MVSSHGAIVQELQGASIRDKDTESQHPRFLHLARAVHASCLLPQPFTHPFNQWAHTAAGQQSKAVYQRDPGREEEGLQVFLKHSSALGACGM